MITPLFFLAALSPLAESVREIDAILRRPEVAELSAFPIDAITRTESGYIVEAGGNGLEFEVIYTPSKKIGPVPFELRLVSALEAGEEGEEPCR